MSAGFWDDADVISVYTRAQGIADGFLVDVTDAARETGFSIPVALTRAAFEDCVAWTGDDDERKPHGTGQDERGRLHDVLSVLHHAARGNGGTDRLHFEVLRVPRDGTGTRPRKARLWALVGPGDDPRPVLTVMLEGED